MSKYTRGKPLDKRNIPAIVDVLMGSTYKEAGERINISGSRMSQILRTTIRRIVLKNIKNDSLDVGTIHYDSLSDLRKSSEYLCDLLNRELDNV